MSKNILQWFWCFLAATILCLVGVMLYLFVVYLGVPYIYKDISHVLSDDLYIIICICAVVDAIAFVIGYSMLRKLNMLASWKFAVYLAVVVGGNLLITFLLSPVASANFLYFILAVFILLVFFNFAISEIFFDVIFRDACLIGMLISLVNTLIGIMITPVCH